MRLRAVRYPSCHASDLPPVTSQVLQLAWKSPFYVVTQIAKFHIILPGQTNLTCRNATAIKTQIQRTDRWINPMRSLGGNDPGGVIRERLREAVTTVFPVHSRGSDFLFLTLRGESHRPSSQGFVLAHTTGQARY